MEVRRWVLGVSLLAIIVASLLYLSMTTGLFVHDYAFMGLSLTKFMDVKNMIMGISMGEIPSEHQHHEVKKERLLVSPNITACHLSIPYTGYTVSCCPPRSESQEPFIDFQFPDPSAPLRVRRPAHLLTEDEIEKYTKAVAMMRSLPYDDPRSFSRISNLHCIYCTGAYNVNNSHLPMQIHKSWMFFPWHRMYLHFFERILGELIGDDTFALHFWNWDNPAGMAIPEMYMHGSLMNYQREASHFPPKKVELSFNRDEEIDPTKEWGGESDPDERMKMNMALMYTQLVSGARTPELFMGCSYKAPDADCYGPGTMENAPHDTVHGWTGSSSNVLREDMGAFYSAARDPLFFAHHTNIDRLWDVWRLSHPDITDSAFLDTYFFFHDEKKRLVRIKFRDVLNITKLGSAYEDVPMPWQGFRPQPSVPPKIARNLLKRRDNDLESYKHSDFGPHGKALDTTITVKVHRPKKQQNEREEEVLVVYGIDLDKEKYVKFDVFVNVADEKMLMAGSRPNPITFREFAGTFVNIPHGSRLLMRKKITLKLGISELLQDLEANEDESIWVTLVPRAQHCMHLTFEGLRIEFMPY